MFRDREEAGKKLVCELVERLEAGIKSSEMLVLSIPRGGVVVGVEVAEALKCEHDVLVAKKIGVFGNEELAMGAVAEDGEPVLGVNYQALGLNSSNEIEKVKDKVRSYVEKFRGGRELDLVGKKVVIVVDDGIATGETARAGIGWLRGNDQFPFVNFQIILAVPVCAGDFAREVEGLVDGFVCLEVPDCFGAVGSFYENFPQVSDDQVVELLDESRTDKDKSD